MKEGHQYLQRELGVRPTVAWQIDSFGHSSVSPTLFREMGLDSLVVNRVPYSVKSEWSLTMRREFFWHGANYSAYPNASLFTHVLADHYNTPKFLNWERGAEAIETENVEMVATQLVEDALNRRQGVQHRNGPALTCSFASIHPTTAPPSWVTHDGHKDHIVVVVVVVPVVHEEPWPCEALLEHDEISTGPCQTPWSN